MPLTTLSDENQLLLLGSIYFNFTGTRAPGRFGSHWERIGFQVCTFGYFVNYPILRVMIRALIYAVWAYLDCG